MREEGISKLYTKVNQVAGYIWNAIYYFVLLVSLVLFVGFGIDKMGDGGGDIFGYNLAEVKTGSMLPTIEEYSFIVGKTVKGIEDVKEKDIVTYTLQEEGNKTLITHRVVGVDVEKELIQTKGDANSDKDLYGDSEYLPIEQVVFRVIHINNKLSPIVKKVVDRPLIVMYMLILIIGVRILKSKVDGKYYKEAYRI